MGYSSSHTLRGDTCSRSQPTLPALSTSTCRKIQESYGLFQIGFRCFRLWRWIVCMPPTHSTDYSSSLTLRGDACSRSQPAVPALSTSTDRKIQESHRLSRIDLRCFRLWRWVVYMLRCMRGTTLARLHTRTKSQLCPHHLPRQAERYRSRIGSPG